MLVHVDTEADESAVADHRLPGRGALLDELEDILGGGVPQAAPAVFHYVGGQVEAEVFLPFDWCADLDRLAALNARIADRVAGSPHWGRIALMCRMAP